MYVNDRVRCKGEVMGLDVRDRVGGSISGIGLDDRIMDRFTF